MLIAKVKIGIVAARSDVFEAFVSESPPIKRSWLKVTPKKLRKKRFR
jgi:hypothetical protein